MFRRETIILATLVSLLVGARILLAAATELPLSSRDQLEALPIQELNGRALDVTAFARKHQLSFIAFWASWCEPCHAELRELGELLESDPRIGVLAVNVGEDATKIDEFVKKHDLQLPLASTVEDATPSLPLLVVLDSRGKVVASRLGYQPGLKHQVDAWLRTSSSAL